MKTICQCLMNALTGILSISILLRDTTSFILVILITVSSLPFKGKLQSKRARRTKRATDNNLVHVLSLVLTIISNHKLIHIIISLQHLIFCQLWNLLAGQLDKLYKSQILLKLKLSIIESKIIDSLSLLSWSISFLNIP